MESEWSTKTNRKQRKADGERQVTAAEEQYQAEEAPAARKRTLSQRVIGAVKKIEVLPSSVYSGDYRL
jgi:hypothetical protein